MSSYMTAWKYLADSQDAKLKENLPRVFPILSMVIQNILDWYYQKIWNSLIHYIHLNDGSGPIFANIVWISLGDGDKAKLLTDSSSLQNCIVWVRWRIRIVCEFNGEMSGIELSTIEKITRKKVFKLYHSLLGKKILILLLWKHQSSILLS